MEKYLCIHGHFYQPPRENPWLEEIERQDSAYPYHDWNQRVNAECYAPNTAARILDEKNKILAIVNNYSLISFNFGPTLLSWMERHEPNIYHAILKADEESQKHFAGHGSAMAQCYNHIIMPLANYRDKKTQILWGIKDFETRFNRSPEGMWLPESAVDLESLDIMAEYGIKYTILAPHQAKSIKKIGEKKFKDIQKIGLNTQCAYLCYLPSGRRINLFFYDGSLSQSIAFGGILNNGENFAKQLISHFSKGEDPQLVHVATDGETYGHHHHRGDMALAYCLNYIKSHKFARLINYGEFLEKYPPRYEVQIIEHSSWSCIHGIERWRNDCGCKTGYQTLWNQKWRAPLRGAMDWLRDNLIKIFEEHFSKYTEDCWNIRDKYIEVILSRNDQSINQFFLENIQKELNPEENIEILKLLELQRHAMLMYTSCGWFFDDVSGIETIQVMQYAARAMQLAKDISSIALEETYIKLLEHASSNVPEQKNGAIIYEKNVFPSVLDLVRVGAHYAISSLFKEYSEKNRIYSYTANNISYDRYASGKQKLVIGKAFIRSNITWENNEILFAVLHLGDHNIIGGVSEFKEDKTFSKMHQEIKEYFKKNDVPGTIHTLEKHFENGNYSLWHLFKDDQSKILYQILHTTLEEIELSLRQINEHHYPIIQVIKQLNIPLPKILSNTVSVMINTDFLQVLGQDIPDFERLLKLVSEVREWALEIDKVTLAFVVQHKINNLMEELLENSNNIQCLVIIESLLRILAPLSLKLDLWKAQNIYFSIRNNAYGEKERQSNKEISEAKDWVNLFNRIGHYLQVRID